MTTVMTDMRNTIESARRIRFEPALPVTATTVQDAIVQAEAIKIPVVPTPVNFAASPYSPVIADQLLEVDTSGGPVVINLPTGVSRAGLDLEIKDITGQAGNGTNAISIVPSGAETVDGLAPYPIDAAFGSVKLGPKSSGGYFVHA